MKPSVFKYHDPHTLEDALGLMGTLENARPLAGGQSLMAMINMRFALPDHLVDLNRIAGLAGIQEQPGLLHIGAMTRQRDLEFSPLIAQRLPLMAEALLHVGHRQTRNRGTLGGSLCHLDPAAELVTVSAACDAVVEIASSRGRREIDFGDFPLGYMMPNVEPDELVVGVRYAPWPAGHGSAFVEFSRRHGDFAIVSAAALLLLDGAGRIARASLALGGVGSAPLRMREVEQALAGQVPTDAVLREAAESCRNIESMDDALVTADYRRSLAVVMARRALASAAARAASTQEVLQ
ncbi:MAG: xanthine dehydrogenase family protein subunit M [Pigmentiphaga sp.]|uniref:FAD binding domain-containing protein n=1 Tax=Pigmentiphaga sp. TaxID=1977564 RepID=UPI0029B3A89B|nr:xanthine dehydrogenase family protein subunit M [Pigmentiphaga sp.]MDX3908033.1 xanthine dehydrogenase family protein subunit M [Pigmentiphaga sp.]